MCPCVFLYLTLDACQAAGAGLGLTKASAVTPARFPGQTQRMKLLLLLLVDALHPRRQEESLPLPGRIRLHGASIVQLRLADVVVIALGGNSGVSSEWTRFVLANGLIGDPL